MQYRPWWAHQVRPGGVVRTERQENWNRRTRFTDSRTDYPKAKYLQGEGSMVAPSALFRARRIERAGRLRSDGRAANPPTVLPPQGSFRTFALQGGCPGRRHVTQ